MIERKRRTSSLDTLLYWATEREAIRRKKEAGEPPPWTTDPILQKYRFCNVRRRDDRVSRWLIEYVYYTVDYQLDVYLKLVSLCRWVNWPPTINKILTAEGLVTTTGIDLSGCGKLIDRMVIDGQKAWTGAYMIRAPKREVGLSKGVFVAEVVVGGLPVADLQAALLVGGCQSVWAVLTATSNWGSFMAGQVVADLTYTPVLGRAYDLYSWAPQGPGSRRGFNRLMRRPLKQKIPDEEWTERLIEWRAVVANATGLPDFTLHDQQNVLCEFDKYERVRLGQGRPRSLYKPETEY